MNIAKALKGVRIKGIRKASPAECKAEMWEESDAPSIIVLDNGMEIWAMIDQEGNGQGSLILNDVNNRQQYYILKEV